MQKLFPRVKGRGPFRALNTQHMKEGGQIICGRGKGGGEVIYHFPFRGNEREHLGSL